MTLFQNARWIDHTLINALEIKDFAQDRLHEIKTRLKNVVSHEPVVSVIIAAWNEEVNIIKCLDSLSRNITTIPFEIIVVNNNSTDRTQEILDMLEVPSYFQSVQGVGPSRELGQQKANGKYILSADADCLYPPQWIEIMTRTLMQEGTVFVYGRFSYISDKKHSRWQLFVYEKFRDLLSEIRHFKRPYLNSYGISLGYVRELGLKEGHLNKNIRGFDGRLCFDLMKHGKVVMIRNEKAKAWTGTRALERDGTFIQAITKRVLRELARLDDYFSRQKLHDTKNSQNRDYSTKKSLESIKKKYNPFRFLKK